MIKSGLKLLDTTLRDGEQAPGVCFDARTKLLLLSEMYEAGLRYFEIGTPAIGQHEQTSIRLMLNEGPQANYSVWCRANINDLVLAHRLGANCVNISLPVSNIQLKAIGKDQKWVLNELDECLKFAQHYFDDVYIGAQDASRADWKFLNEYISFANQFKGVKRIRIADTVGVMNPFSVQRYFDTLTQNFTDLEFEFHGHNDLGMANANALAAYVGGAKVVSGTINGLGERCGNTPIEELVIALEYSVGVKININKQKLRKVGQLVAKYSKRKIYAEKPFNGEMCFTHESGIHTRSLMEDELAYQPFKARETGGEMKFVFGKHSGGKALRFMLEQNGIAADNEKVMLLLNEIKNSNIDDAEGLDASNICQLYRQKFYSPKFIGNNPTNKVLT